MNDMDVARTAAAAGAAVVTKYFHEGVTIRSKGHDAEAYNLVSDADVDAEEAIVDVIRQAFPDDSILGEESHKDDTTAERLWIIDPLDGTNNFAHDVPHFAVSVALWIDGVPACGVVTNPVREDTYEAIRGGGAFHNGNRIQVGTQKSLDQVLVGVGFYYDRGAMMERTLDALKNLFGQSIHGIRRFGTASLDLAAVATGQLGAFFEYQLSPWDFAAGLLIVEEAGGSVTDCRGRDVAVEKTSVLATNSHLHDQVLEIVSAHHP